MPFVGTVDAAVYVTLRSLLLDSTAHDRSRRTPGCSGRSPFLRGRGAAYVVDLGMSPPCETILERAQLNQMEAFYPLHVFVCDQCFFVQLQEYVAPEDIFTDYTWYFFPHQLVGTRKSVYEADD